MSQKKVVVHIDSDGSTTIDAQGFTGNSCTLATRELEVALTNGGQVDSDSKKPDFYASHSQGIAQRN